MNRKQIGRIRYHRHPAYHPFPLQLGDRIIIDIRPKTQA